MDNEYGGSTGRGVQSGTHRFRTVVRTLYIACFVLLLALFVGAALLDPQVATAAQQRTPDLVEGSGRQIGAVDWLYHLPLALGAALLVIVVDVIVIIRIVLGRRRSR